MIATSRALARAACCTLVMTTLGAGMACTDFPRVNPFDEEAKVALVVSGPDSVTAIGDTVTFDVQTIQGESLDQLASWNVPGFLARTRVPNQFVVVGQQNSTRASGNIEARVNASTAIKPVVFVQQARSLTVGCNGGLKVMPFSSFLDASDPTFGAGTDCAKLFDRRGNRLPDGPISGTIRDTRVVRFVLPNQLAVNAVSNGSTYVVYTGAGFTDSIRADVRQDFAFFKTNPVCPPAPGLVLSPGQTVQITPVPSDAHGNPIADPAIASAALAGLQWITSDGLNVTVSSSGLVTAVGPSEGYVYAMKVYFQPVVSCYVTVR